MIGYATQVFPDVMIGLIVCSLPTSLLVDDGMTYSDLFIIQEVKASNKLEETRYRGFRSTTLETCES